MAGTRYPLEAKTQAAGIAATVAGVIIYLLQTYAFKGSSIPAGLVSLIYAAVPGILALVAAYLAPHTSRPAPVPPPAAPAHHAGGAPTQM